MNTSGSLWKPINQLHVLKLLITILSKAVEDQQFEENNCADFWTSEPKIGPKLAQNWPKNKFKYKILISIPKGVVNQANTSVNCVETFYYNANKKQ